MKANPISRKSTAKPARSRAPVIEMPAPAGMPPVPVEAVMSFLKETRGSLTWTTRDMISSLKISGAEADRIVEILVMQGDVKRSSQNGEWITTIAGESVSGSKPPRFALPRVEQALADVRQRIKTANQSGQGSYQVSKAVTLGDFMQKPPLVQAADVGVTIQSKHGEKISAENERAFMRMLRSRSPLLHVRPYKSWMSRRTHHPLL